MLSITEGQLRFDFPNGWQASKFDDWSFYKNQFQKVANALVPCSKCDNRNVAGTKGIDILAIDGRLCCWNIEIKDYRRHRRTKIIDLADEVALKVRDSLAALVAAQANANDANEKKMAKDALRCPQLRVVLHLEQPTKHSRLFPRAIDRAKVQQRLKQLIKAIDPHPLVIEKNQMNGVAWAVS